MKFSEVSSGLSSKNFIKLNNGDSVQGVFQGDPYTFRVHWLDNRTAVCEGKDKCEPCKSGDKAKFRFRINLVISENGVWTAKIFENSWTAYDYLKSLHGADYDLEKTVIKITRKGEKLNTTYDFIPVPPPKGVLKPEHLKQIAAVKLLDLKNPSDETASDASDDGVPF